MEFLLQIGSAVIFLHDNSMIHKNISDEVVYVDGNERDGYKTYITDFGDSSNYYSDSGHFKL
jgi:serine/threonine protein kinase